jgi:hypothetical protein
LRWGLGAGKVHYLYKERLHTDQASGDLIGVVTSCFYGRVHDLILEGLMRIVRKSKKLIDNRNAGASDRRQEEGRKRTHGETLRRALLTEQRQKRPLKGSIK